MGSCSPALGHAILGCGHSPWDSGCTPCPVLDFSLAVISPGFPVAPCPSCHSSCHMSRLLHVCPGHLNAMSQSESILTGSVSSPCAGRAPRLPLHPEEGEFSLGQREPMSWAAGARWGAWSGLAGRVRCTGSLGGNQSC